jgi:hypothetical protein
LSTDRSEHALGENIDERYLAGERCRIPIDIGSVVVERLIRF